MSVSIAINPLSDSLDMYGEPDTSSAYSLSGYVTISVSSPFSLFERRRTARLLLKSVSLTFEGQSEAFAPQIGYTSFRLCSITRELAPNEPVELNNEGREGSNETCHWNVVFNIPIPGWLPESSSFGVEDLGIRYGLYATAKLINIDDTGSAPWSFTTLCSPFRSRVKSVQAQKNVVLRRYMSPSSIDSAASLVTYLVNSSGLSSNVDTDKHIPPEVLSKIHVLASVPEHVNIDDNSLPITLRLRTKDLEESECKRLQVTKFSVDLTQIEKCRYRPTSEYLSRYPVPPESSQPPNKPLRDPHAISTLYDIGLHVSPTLAESTSSRSFSLLPPDESGKYILSENNYVFANDTETVDPPTWYTLETAIPFIRNGRMNDECAEWGGVPRTKPTAISALFGVRQELSISVTCSYDVPNSGETVTGQLSFTIPVRFVQMVPPQPPRSLSHPPSHSHSASPSMSEGPALPPLVPYTHNLPAYSQLFDYNGDRKIDYSVPLPLYTPRSSTSTSPTLELDVVSHERKVPNRDTDQLLPEANVLS